MEGGVTHDGTGIPTERGTRESDQGIQHETRSASAEAGYPMPRPLGSETQTGRSSEASGRIRAALDALELFVQQLEALARKTEQLLERKLKRYEERFESWFGMRP